LLFTKNLTTHPLKPYGFANRCFYSFGRALVYCFLKIYCAFRREGPYLPEGPFIVAANHESFIDPPILQLAVGRRRVRFLMIESFYYTRLLNRFCNVMRCVAVKTESLNKTTMNLALEILEARLPVAIFPQGARMEPGDLGGASKGVAFLARRAQVPVIPVRIRGTGRVLPKGAWFPRPRRVSVHVGDAIEFPQGEGEKVSLDEFKETIMSAIAAL